MNRKKKSTCRAREGSVIEMTDVGQYTLIVFVDQDWEK
ncbi:hypothetical protein PATSB16_03010 [Pandoraea thiooxydans]|nr:hypothetical protein PATSB16_03010 [Pandoraea thiooxydans]